MWHHFAPAKLKCKAFPVSTSLGNISAVAQAMQKTIGILKSKGARSKAPAFPQSITQLSNKNGNILSQSLHQIQFQPPLVQLQLPLA